MLTIFTAPKPFRGHIAVIQKNAIRSWLKLCPECEVILFGDEDGVAETAAELGTRYVGEVKRNEYGTPLISDLFAQAQRLTTHALLCYSNADIILMSDFLQAVERLSHYKRRFLMVGRRWNLDVTSLLNFDSGWEDRLRSRVRREGILYSHKAMDYFVFPTGILGSVPNFAVGRAGWDNWMLYRARELGVAVVDATTSVMAVHQNHDYSHYNRGAVGVFEGPEAKRNVELAGGLKYLFRMRDATYILTPEGLKRPLDWWHLRRHLDTLPLFHPSLQLPAQVLLKIICLSHALRSQAGWTIREPEEENRE